MRPGAEVIIDSFLQSLTRYANSAISIRAPVQKYQVKVPAMARWLGPTYSVAMMKRHTMEPPEKVNRSLSRVGVTCEQAVQLGKSREVTRSHARAARERGRKWERRVFSRLPSLAINGEFARKLVLRLRLPLRLGQFWVELHYGTVLDWATNFNLGQVRLTVFRTIEAWNSFWKSLVLAFMAW